MSRFGVLLAALVLGLSGVASAQPFERDWTGGTDDKWDTNANWSGSQGAGQPNTANEDARFLVNGANGAPILDSGGTTTIGDLEINPEAGNTFGETLTISNSSILSVSSATMADPNTNGPSIAIVDGNQIRVGHSFLVTGGTFNNADNNNGVQFTMSVGTAPFSWTDNRGGTPGTWGDVRVGLDGTTLATATLVATSTNGITVTDLDIQQGILDLATNNVAMTVTGNLTIRTGGALTLGSGTLTVTGNITVETGGTLTIGAGAINGSGNVTLNGATINHGNGNFSFDGNLDYDGTNITYNQVGTGVLIFAISGSRTWDSNSTSTTNGIGNVRYAPTTNNDDVTITGNTIARCTNLELTQAGTGQDFNVPDTTRLIVTGTLTLTGSGNEPGLILGNGSGGVSLQTGGLTVSNGLFDEGTGEMEVSGNVTFNPGTYSADNGGDFTFNGGVVQTFSSGTTFDRFRVRNGSTVQLASAIATTDIQISDNTTTTIDLQTFTLTVSDTIGLNPASESLIITGTTGSCVLNDGLDNLATGTTLTVNGGTLTINGNIAGGIAGTINQGGGTIQVNGNADLSGLAGFTATAGTFEVLGASRTVTVDGVQTFFNFTANGSGTHTLANGTSLFDVNGTLNVNANLSVSGTGNSDVEGVVTIDNTATLNSGNSLLDLNAALTITDGTVTIGGGGANLNGNVTFGATGTRVLNAGANAVLLSANLVGTNSQTVTLNNLTLDGAGQALTLAGGAGSFNSLTMNQGAAGNIVTVSGANTLTTQSLVLTQGILNLQTNSTSTGGNATTIATNATFRDISATAHTHTFSSNNGGNSVVLTGTMTFTGAGHSVLFDSTNNFVLNASSSFTLNGSPGTAALGDDDGNNGTVFNFNANATATVNVSNATITDAPTSGGAQTPILATASTVTDTENAGTWINGTVWTGTTNTNWSTGTNWTGGAPNASTAAVFNASSNVSNQPNTGAGSLPAIAGLLFFSSYTGDAVNVATLDAGLTVSGEFSFEAGAGGDFSLGANTLTLNGLSVTVNSAAALQGTGLLLFNSGGATSLTVAASTVLPRVQLSTASTNVTPANGNAFSITTSLTVDAGTTLSLNTNDPIVTVSGTVTATTTGAIVADAGTLNVSGAWSSGGGISFSGTHTTEFNGAGGLSVANADAFENVTSSAGARTQSGGGTMAITGNLVVSGGTLSSAVGITVTGTSDVDGALTFTGGTSALNGNWLVGSTGTLTVNGTTNLTLDGTVLNFSASDVQSAATATVTLGTTDGKTLTVTALDNFPNLTVNGSTTVSGTLDVNGNLLLNDAFTFGTGGGTVDGTVTGTAGTLTLDGTVNVGGTGANAFNLTNLALSAGTGTDRLNLTGVTPTLTTNGQTFNILQISATNPVPVTGTLTANSTLDLDTGGITLANAANSIGALDFVGGTLTLAGTNLVCGGAWSQTGGTFTPGTTRVDLNAGAGSTVRATGTFGGGLRVTGAGTYAATGNILVAGAALEITGAGGLTYASASANTAGSVDLSGTGNLTGSNGTLSVAGAFSSAANNFVNGGMAVTITAAGGITQNTGNPFQNLTVTGAGVIVTGSLDVNGALLVSGGTVTLPNATHDVDGNVTVNGGGLMSFNATSCVLQVGGSWNLTGAGVMANLSDPDVQIVFDTNNTNTITPAGQGFGDLRINNGSSTISSAAALTVADQLDVDAGTLNANAGITVGGLIDIQGGTLAGTTVDADGNLSIGSGSFTASGLSFTGAGAQTLDDDTATPGQNYGALVVNNGNNGVTLIGTPGDVRANTLTLTNGSLTLNGNQLSLVGNSVAPVSITTGTLAGNTGTVRFAGTGAGTITIPTTNVTYQNLTIDAGGQTYAPGAALALNNGGTFTLTAGTYTAGGTTLTVPGGFLVNSGTFTAGTGIVILNGGTQAVNVGANVLNTLRTTAAGTKTVTGALGVTLLDLDAGELALSTSGASIGTGGLDVDGGTLTANAGASTISCAGNWDIASGTFAANASTVLMQGASVASIIQGGQPFNNLRTNKSGVGTLTVTGVLDVNGRLDVDGGPLNLFATGADVEGVIDIGGGTLVGNGGTIFANDNWNRTAGGFTINGTTVEFDGGTQSITPGGVAFGAVRINGTNTDTVTAALTCANLTMDAGNLSLGGVTAINGDLTINAGTLDANGNAVTVTGNSLVTGTLTVDAGGSCDLQSAGTFGGTGTINLNGTARLEIRAAGVNLANLTAFNGSATSTFVLDGAATHTLTLDGAVTIGNLQCDRSVTIAGTALTTAGTVVINVGTLTLTTTGASLAGTVSGAGTLSAAGAVNVSVGAGLTTTGFTAGTGTLTFNGTGFWNGNGNTFGNVSITAGTVTTQSDIVMSGNLIVSATLQLQTNTNNISVAGASTSVTLTGGTWTQAATNTLTFNGSGTQVLIGGGNTIGSLVVSTSDVNITTSNLTIAGTTTVAATRTLAVASSVTQMNFGSSNAAASLVSVSGILSLDASTTFSGNLTVNNGGSLRALLNPITIRFADTTGGSVTTIANGGTFQVNPTAAGQTNLFSENTGTAWSLNIVTNGAETLADIRVQDSNASAGTPANSSAVDSDLGGPNVNWPDLDTFTAVWDGSQDNDWDDTRNWVGDVLPTNGAQIQIMLGAPNLPQDRWTNLKSGQSITFFSGLDVLAVSGTLRFTAASMVVNGTVSISAGTATIDAQDDFTVSGQITLGAGTTLDCDGAANVNVSAGGISGGTFVKPTGTGDLTITGGTWSGGSDFGDVILTTAAPTTGSALSMDTLVITGITLTPAATHNITVNAGAISGTGGLSLVNNVTASVSGGLTVTTFTAGASSTLSFTGTGNWGSTAAGGFGAVTITGNGTQVSLLAAKSASSIAINGPTAGARLRLAGFGLTVSGNVTLGDGGGNDGDLEANTGAAVVQIGGNLVFQDTSTVITPANLTTTFTGAGPHTLTPPNPTASLGNLPINATVVVNAAGGSGTLSCEALTINATGALNAATLSFQANGSVDLSGTFAMSAAGTFTFGKTGAAVVTETFNTGGKTLPDVVVTGTNKVLNQNAGALTINGTTTISAGADLVIAATAGTATFANDGTGAVSVTGAGSVLQLNGTTNFRDAVTVTSSGSFIANAAAALYQVGFSTTAATALSIDTGCTITIGADGGNISDVDLRPFGGVNSPWVIFVHTGATQTVHDVRVRFSNVSNAANSDDITVLGAGGGVDLGNNDNVTTPRWVNLNAVNPTWIGGTDTNWANDANWNPSAPTAGSTCTFTGATTFNPVLNQPTDLVGIITLADYTGTIALQGALNLSTLTHAGGNLNLNNQVLSINGNVVLNREILDGTLGAGTGSVVFNGGGQQLTVNAGGAAIQAPITINGGSTLTGQAGSGQFNVEALTVTGTFNTGGAANIAVLVSQTTTVTGTLTGNASAFTLAGSLTTTGATAANFGTATTRITGASTFNLANTTFGTLDINAAGNTVAVAAGTLSVSTLLSATAGTFTFNAAGSTLGSLTTAAGTTVNAAGAIGITGPVTLAAGTFTPGTSTVNLTGGAQAISTGANAFFNLSTANAGTDVVTGILDVNGTLTVTTNAVLQLGAAADVEGNLTVSGGGTFNVNGNNVNAAGATVDFSGGSLTNPGASTFTLDGGAVAFDPNAQTFFNLTVASGANATLGAAFTSSGVLTVTGTLAQSGNQITLTGATATPMTGAGVFTGNGTVLYNTTGSPAGGYIIPALGFQNVTVAQAARVYQNDVGVNLSGTLTVNNNVTYRLDNTLTAGAVSGAGTPVINLNSQTLRVTNGAPFAGTALANLQNVLTSTIDYGGPAGQTVGNITYGSVVFSGSGVNYTALPNPLTVTVNLTFNNGAGVGGTPNVTFTGTASNSAFNGGTSSITLGTVTVTKQDLNVSSTNADLSFNGTSGTRVIQNLVLTTGRVLILEDATIQSGTIGAAGSAIQAQLRVASTGTNLTVGLAGQTRTITIFDSVQIGFGAAGVVCTMASGASTNTTFALNDADAELRFQGQSGNNVQVLTSTNGQSGFITSSVSSFNTNRGASGLFASVRDNNASGYMDGTVSASSSIDLGNNVNWDFQGGGNITGIRATALGDGNGRIDRVQVMFGGTTGLQSSTLSTAHQQFALVQTDGSGNDLQSITGTASAIASTPSNRGLLVTFGSGLGKTDVTNVELRYTAPSSGFLTNTGGVPASISFTLTAAAGTLQDGAPPVLISSFFQDLDANDGLDRGSFFFSEPPAFKASCGVSISGWNPVTNTTDMGGNTLLTLEIAGEQLAAIDVAQAPFTTGAQIAAEIQTRVRNLITSTTPASTNPGGHNPLNRPAYRNFTATFDGQRYIFKAGIPLRFDSATSQYVQDHSRSTVRVITGGVNDVSATMQLSSTNGGVERAGRGNARQGISVSESLASSGVAISAIGGTLSLQMNGEVSRSYTIATGSTTTAQVAALVETAVRGTVNDSTNDPDSVANANAYTNFVCVPDSANGGRLILISGQQGSGSSVVVDTLSSFANVAHIGSNFFAAGASERAGTSNTEVFLETLTVRLGDGSNPLLGKGDGDVSIAGNVVTVDLANVAGSGLATPAFQWRDNGGGLFFSDAAPVPNAASSPAGNFTAANAVVITGDSDGDLSVSRSPGAQVLDASGSLPPLGNTGVSTSFSWTWVSGPSDPLSGSTFNGPALSFSATTAGSYVFRLTITVVDGSGNPVVTAFSDAQGRLIRDVTVVITEDKPIASAGADLTLVATNLQVQLDGTGSFDPNGGSIAYMWSAVNTATNTLVTPSPFDDATISQPTFTAPASGRYTITLTVRKVNLETSQGTDTATVTITDPSSLFPVADAGDDQVGRINTQITLNGTASSHPASNPQSLTYAWSIISSPEPVTLSDAAVASPTFTPTTPGSYVFGLVVQTTGLLTSQTDQVTIQIIDDQSTSPRVPPSAVALVAGLRNGVFLTGAAPGFNLSQPPVFVLRDGLERDVTVIDLAADAGDDPLSTAVAGFHKVEVMVSGSLFATLYAPQVTGDAQVVQLRPIKGEAALEDVQAYGVSGTSFVLDASNSQDDGVVSTATWTQVSGPFQFTSQTGSLLAVVPQSAGTYVFDLVVTDNIGLSSFTSRVAVPVIPANLTLPAGPPSAAASVAGGQTVTIEGVVTFVAGQGQAVSLSAAGSISRVTGTPQTGSTLFTYNWTQLLGPTAVLAATNTEVVSAQLLVPGGYLFQVEVTDTNGVSSFAQVWISVGTSVANALVAAVATIQDAVLPSDGNGLIVTFDASQSQGSGTGATYIWSQTAGSPVFVALAPGTGGEQGTVVITQPGTYTFTVRINDGTTTSAPQTISFKVSAPAEQPLSSGASLKESSGGCALVADDRPRGAGAWLFLALGLVLLVLRGRRSEERA